MAASIVDIPAKSNLLTLTSPSFTMNRPVLRGEELIPASALQAMNSTWNTAFFSERPVTFDLVEDVYIVEEGLIFDADGRLFQTSITQHSPAEIDRGYLAVQAALKEGCGFSSNDTIILCKKRGCQNYGHWLIEMLPKAHLARLHLNLPEAKFAIPLTDGKLKQAIDQSLHMMSIDRSSVRPIDNSVHRFRSVIIINGLTNHGTYMSPLVINCLDTLSSRVNGRGSDRLYVKRTDIVSRRLANESSLDSFTSKHGYVPVDPNQLTFSEQVQVFKNAYDVVGVMGAAMTNIVFAPIGSRIVNLAPADMPDTFFWFIAGLRRQKYTEVRCLQTGPVRGIAPWDRDMILKLEDLDEEVLIV